MAANVSIDEDECLGCETCVETCPSVFAMDDDGEKATLVDPDAEVTEKVEKAAAYCPQKCIEFY